MQRLFSYLAGGDYNNILTQYTDSSSAPMNYVHNDVHLVTSAYDTGTPPASLTIQAIGQEVLNTMAAHAWPNTADTMVMVYPQPGTTYDASFNEPGNVTCGEHDFGTSFAGNLAFVVFGMVRYPPDTGTACNYSAPNVVGSMQQISSHEYAEMATDPEVTGVNNAWTTSDGKEVADLCNFGAQPYDAIGSPAILYVSELWDNSAKTSAFPYGQCMLAHGHEYPSPDTASPFNGKHTVQGAIFTHYDALNTISGPLGQPVSEETPLVNASGVEDGQVSYFQGTQCGGQPYGAIYSTYTGTGSVRGCIDQYYANSLGGPHSSSVPLGYPTGDEQTIPGGYYNQFQGTPCGSQTYGAIYYGVTKGWVVGCIEKYYEDLGSHGTLTAPLSFPVGGQQQIPGGWVNYFHGKLCGANYYGAIYYGATKGWIVGCIEQHYEDIGGPSSSLGFPVNGQQQIPGGYVNYFQGPASSCASQICGALYWSASTGSHAVAGGIYSTYSNLGGPANTQYGFPVSDMVATGGGQANYFGTGGTTPCGAPTPYGSIAGVYWSASTGAHGVQGGIYQRYICLLSSAHSGDYRLPVSDMVSVPGGLANYFGTGGGSQTPYGSTAGIYWSASTGAHGVGGAIYTKYIQRGGPGSSAYGLPVTDMLSVPGGLANYFGTGGSGPSGSKAAIYWSATTGAHGVQGGIYTKYASIGGPNSNLGLPLSDEYTNAAGNFESDFVGGTITWVNGTAVVQYNCVGTGLCS
jgi:uncharacterized protein with LGFP repeats